VRGWDVLVRSPLADSAVPVPSLCVQTIGDGIQSIPYRMRGISRPYRTVAVYSVQIVDYAQRVREICTKLSTARDSEWQPLLEELREVLREHDRWVRTVAAATMKNSIDTAA